MTRLFKSSEETFDVVLSGGSPWGFTLQGGSEFRTKLSVSKVTQSEYFFFRSLTDSLGSNKPKKKMMVSLISSRISPLAVFVYCGVFVVRIVGRDRLGRFPYPK